MVKISFGLVNERCELTNAGALLADESPIRCSRLFCTRWNGLNKSGGAVDALDDVEYSGSVISLIENGEAFIKRNCKMKWRKIANSREEMPGYVERSYHEALVNALAHRDYLVNGSEVHIDIYDDRMEIYSPGGMPDGSMIQDRDPFTVASTRRNPVLADVFNRLGYMERKGSGFGKIISGYEFQINYNESKRPYIVQHITEEAEHFTNTKGSSPDIKKIVQELIIKGDVRERMISIFDWERLDSGKDWTFVLRKKIKTKYGENAAHINHVNKKALNYFQYYRLEIDCNGEMKFDTFCDSNQDEAEEWNKICYAYDFVEDKHRGAQNPVEGLMYSDIDNIHAILLTREKTLPNISALMNTLMETDAKERVSKELLLEAIDDFEKDNIDSRECISEWKSKVAAETEMITKKAMKKILNMRTGIASKFNRFLHEKYGVWIDGELRKGEFEATYQIGNLLNIKYEYNEKDYLDGRTFVYYVGAKSKRLAYPNACCMRKVISLGEELEYEEALPLMAVEFVRNSQYTVLPFPFKYLREYIEQC